MKAARVLLLCAGVFVALLLLVLGVALNTSFQTWAARRALAQQADVTGTVGKVSAGLRRTEVRDLRIVSQGAVLTVPSLTVELPLLPAGVSEKVAVKSLVAKGWTLDLTRAIDLAALLPSGAFRQPVAAGPRPFSLLSSAYAADATVAAKSTFKGVFDEMELPVDFSLDGLDLEGEVIVPVPGETAARIKVDLRGGGLAAGREGSFDLALAAAKADGGALTLRSTLTAAMDTPRTFNRLGAKAAAAASGTQIPNGVKLDIESAALRTTTGESYTLLLSAAGKTLVDVAATLTEATARVTGTWKLDLHDGDVAPFLLGRELPIFAAIGEGKFESDASFGEIHANGAINASADRWDFLLPELSAVEEMSLVADFDVLQHGQSLRVERLNATLAAAAPVGSVRALQPFEFNLATAEMRVADPTKDLVGLSLTGVPVGWARPFLGEFAVTGGVVRGEFAGSARDGGLAFRSKAPLTVTGLSVTQAGSLWLRGIDIALTASADYTPQGWQAQIVSLGVRSGGATLLSLDAKAGQLAGEGQSLKATGRWSANLPGWLEQPLVAGQLLLATGLAQGEFSASVDGTKSLETKLGLSNLTTGAGEKLPSISLDVRADVAVDGKTTFNIPVSFSHEGRNSDLGFAGTLTPGERVSRVDARLSSDVLVMKDVQLLALLIPAEDPARGKPAGPEEGVPFWNKLEGELTLALKKVIYGETFEVTEVGGRLRIDPAALRLDALRAKFGPESGFTLEGGVTYAPQQAKPYTLAADLAVTNFDMGQAFRAIDPAKLPTVEARINVASRVTGSGVDLGEVAERASGELQVTGKSGVFRALSADLTNRVQKTQSTVAAIGGIIGAVTGKQEYSDYANKTQILTDIAKALSEIPFDQLNVTATRSENLNLVLKDFTLISPEIRLTGGGGITHVEGTPLLAQPLALQLNLGARGQLADLLKRAGLVEPRQDNLGYASFVTPITIGGTLAHTDTRELQKALLNSALEKGGLLDSLLGK